MEGADVAVAYCGHERFKPPLYILDVVAGPLWRDFFTDTAARLGELKRACTAPWMQVYAPADLVLMFEGAGLLAQAPPDWFDAERSLAFAAGIVAVSWSGSAPRSPTRWRPRPLARRWRSRPATRSRWR